MKKLMTFIAAGLLAPLVVAQAAPFNESKGYEYYAVANPIQKTIQAPAQALPLDNYIVALAKASQFNLIANVTPLADAEWVQPYATRNESAAREQRPNFLSVLIDLEQSQGLSDWRYDENTFLLWQRPAKSKALQLMLEADRQHRAGALPVESALYKELNDLALRSIGSLGEGNALLVGGSPQIKGSLGELPLDLRQQLKAVASHAILSEVWNTEALLDDANWKRARIGFVPTAFDNKGKASRISLSVSLPAANGEWLPAFYSSGYNLTPVVNYDEDAPVSSIFTRASKVGFGDADTTANTAETRVALPGLSATELEQDAALQSPITLEVKRASLKSVVSQIAVQGGVALQIGADVPAESLMVTARVEAMPTGAMLGALARTYDLYWAKSDGGALVLHRMSLTPLQSLLRRTINPQLDTVGAEWLLKTQRVRAYQALEQQIWSQLQVQGVKQEQTVSFSALPSDLRDDFRTLFQQFVAENVTQAHRSTWQFVSDEMILKLWRGNSLGDGIWHLEYLISGEKQGLTSVEVRPDAAEQKALSAQLRQQRMEASLTAKDLAHNGEEQTNFVDRSVR